MKTNLIGFFFFFSMIVSSMKHTPKKEGGADYETAQRIVMALACFHAKFWDDSDNALDTLRKKYCPVAEHDSYWVNQIFLSFLLCIVLLTVNRRVSKRQWSTQ